MKGLTMITDATLVISEFLSTIDPPPDIYIYIYIFIYVCVYLVACAFMKFLVIILKLGL